MSEHHVPVMLKESLDLLITDRSGIYFDATLGFGGHSSEILKRINNDGRLIASDVDTDAFEFSKNKFAIEVLVKVFSIKPLLSINFR